MRYSSTGGGSKQDVFKRAYWDRKAPMNTQKMARNDGLASAILHRGSVDIFPSITSRACAESKMPEDIDTHLRIARL